MDRIPEYLDESLPFEERAEKLVSKMTLFEKASQLTYNSAAVERLGVPAYNWWNEALHGVARAGVATVFPQAIGLAATFDEQLLWQVADVISTEGRAKHHEFVRKNDRDIYKGLTFWSPNLNIFRDPRWGRGHETYGEDPYLTARLGVAFIRGIQGEGPSGEAKQGGVPNYLKAAACAKHFAVHSGPENERHSFDAVVSKKDLRETYLPAFKAAVCEAKVEAVMGAYNRVNGEPCCGSPTLLHDILREEWGFKGHVTSDCWAIKDFHEHHHVTTTAVESVALALNNGCDLNCGNMYLNLMLAHQEGLVTEEAITLAAVRLMTARMKLGMFDKPEHVPYASIPFEQNDCRQHNEFALEVSQKTLVLLKNEGGLLPLDKNSLKSIAVIGPNANSRAALIGNYHGTASRYVTVLEGIQQAVAPGTRVWYAEGCHLYKNRLEGLSQQENDGIAEAVAVAQRADVVVVCLGLDETIEGEEPDGGSTAGGDKRELAFPGLQNSLLEQLHKTGKPIVLVTLAGSCMSLQWADDHIPAILQAWYPGASGGKAVASVLFGEFSPSGKLPVTFYRSEQDLPDFTDYSMKNRTYRYMQKEALYPFGYGLSYTKFEYSCLEQSSSRIAAGESITISVEVTNHGKLDGDEIVQLYLKDNEASVVVPNWQLCGMKRLSLKPGATGQVIFEITPEQMALIDNDGKPVLEPGSFTVYVGGSQPDDRSRKLNNADVLETMFEVSGSPLPLAY